MPTPELYRHVDIRYGSRHDQNLTASERARGSLALELASVRLFSFLFSNKGLTKKSKPSGPDVRTCWHSGTRDRPGESDETLQRWKHYQERDSFRSTAGSPEDFCVINPSKTKDQGRRKTSSLLLRESRDPENAIAELSRSIPKHLLRQVLKSYTLPTAINPPSTQQEGASKI